MALRITNNGPDAAEATQDVFMKVYRNLKEFQFRSSLKTWIYRITVNTALNYYKKNLRYAGHQVEFDPAVEYGCATDPAEALIEQEEKEKIVSDLLNTLVPQQRACIVLREIEGLSYEEIADTLKINLNTVRSRLKRARQKLMGLAEKR